MPHTAGSLPYFVRLPPGASKPIMSNPALQKADTEWKTPSFRALRKPYSGQNLSVSSTAPAASTVRQ